MPLTASPRPNATSTADATPATAAPGRIDALDGLRGLALVGMLAWHAHLEWVRGGFARMTIFFVLSGYLGAQSLLRLRARGGPRPWLGFLGRRARRLLPLTVVGVAAAVGVTALVGSASARQALVGDVAAVLASVSNWRLIAESRSYGALFESPSALQHLWSLSAEEQCFWLLPAILAAAVAVARRSAWAPVAGLAAALLAIPVVVEQSPDAVYYGTPNRAGEFLAGVALALWLADRHDGEWTARGRVAVGAGGAAGLALLLAVMALVDRDLPGLYRGGSALVVLPVLAVLLAVQAGAGLAPRLLAAGWLTALGRWAFSIYVLHWPLYVLMGEGRVPLQGTALALAEMALAVAIGAVAHHLVERPLLPAGSVPLPPSASWRRDRVVLPVAAALGAALVAVAATVPVPPPAYDFEAARQRAMQGPPAAGDVVAADAEASTISSATRVGVLGGSSGVLLGASLWDWAHDVPDVTAVPAWSHHGCGFITEGRRLAGVFDGRPEIVEPDPECLGWESAWLDVTAANRIDVAVVVAGVWETSDWFLPDRPEPVTISDPGFDELLRTKISQAVDDLVARGTRVVLTTEPNVGPGTTGDARAARGLPDDHPRRVARYNDLLRQIAAARDDVAVVDYGAYVDGFEPAVSSAWLPDGIHPTDEAARRIWAEFLGPSLHETIRSTWGDLATRATQDAAEPPDPAEPPDTAESPDTAEPVLG